MTVARTRICSRSPGRSSMRASEPSGPAAWRWTRPTGFSGVPPPGPAMPVTATATSALEPPPRALRHRRGDLGRDRAVLREQHSPARRARAASPRPHTRRRRRRSSRSSRECSVSRAATMPPVQDSAVASRQPRAPREREHELLDPALVACEQPLPEPLDERRPRAHRPAPPHRARRRDRRGSRTRGRRSSPRRRRRRRLPPRAPAPPRTRSRRTAAARAALAAASAPAAPASARSRAAFGQSRRSSLGGPGRTTTTQPVGARKTSPGAVPASPIETAGTGRVACFVTPGAKSAYGLRSRSATPREIASISCSSASSTTSSSPAARASSSTVRSSCVGPEAARDETRVGLEPLAKRRLELGGRVSDDRDARRLEPVASAPRRRGTGRSGRCARRGRARCR